MANGKTSAANANLNIDTQIFDNNMFTLKRREEQDNEQEEEKGGEGKEKVYEEQDGKDEEDKGRNKNRNHRYSSSPQ